MNNTDNLGPGDQFKIFSSLVYIKKNLLFHDKDFESSLNDQFTFCEGRIDAHQVGKAECTVTLENPIVYTKNFKKFLDIVAPHIMEAGLMLGYKNKTGFDVLRGWSNRMYKGCKGRAHKHSSGCDSVAIYYLDAPENSADLYFLDLKQWGLLEEHVPSKFKKRIETRTGTLVIHDPDIYHAVSEHLSDIPRLVIILEIIYRNDDEQKFTTPGGKNPF